MERQSAATRPLRIALVAPPWYPVPPDGYGGTELVVYLLARELQAKGHRVTVFGAGGERRAFKLVTFAGRDWDVDVATPTERFRMATYLRRVYRHIRPGDFDVLHDHTEATGPMLASLLTLRCPIIATVHSALRAPQIELYRDLSPEVCLVAISDAQKRHAEQVHWAATVHNAIDEASLHVGRREDKEDYLVQLGRITPDKGQHVSIDVARRIGARLVLAGKVDPSPRAQTYFRDRIAPELGSDVTWIENVSGTDKADVLARARAMLFPLDWEEPFGIAIVEAMASGTPVIAFRRGAAPELIDDGVTGFVVDSADEMAAAYGRVAEIDPEQCAERARSRFGARRMADAYERVYLDALGIPMATPEPEQVEPGSAISA